MKEKIIKTSDQKEWFVMSTITFEGQEYLLVAGYDSVTDNPTEELKVVKLIKTNAELYVEVENDEQILLKICPMLEKELNL